MYNYVQKKKRKKEEAVSYAKMQFNYSLYLINSAITKICLNELLLLNLNECESYRSLP